jgi:hypothetical protein
MKGEFEFPEEPSTGFILQLKYNHKESKNQPMCIISPIQYYIICDSVLGMHYIICDFVLGMKGDTGLPGVSSEIRRVFNIITSFVTFV